MPVRRSRLKVVKLRRGKVPDDTRFIETLVWALDKARKGEMRGYAFVFTVDGDDGVCQTIEGADVTPSDYWRSDAMTLLGAMRLMEGNFIERNWGDDAGS